MQTPSAERAPIDQTLVALAQAMAPELEPAAADREFRIKVISNGVTANYKHRCADAMTAAQHGMELCGIGGRVVVEPVIEMTEGEGRARYPEQLHRDAFTDAWRGWHEEAQRSFDAIGLQIRRQGSAV